ncbi:hypothetical protein ACHAW5_001718 [Stephanodiscus triporus]|uniref:Uncharacterized protein n=1 Tax=Stephanodiscus triporus TaxID=2934178 RepID=A0ABD3QVZ3_9STRA
MTTTTTTAAAPAVATSLPYSPSSPISTSTTTAAAVATAAATTTARETYWPLGKVAFSLLPLSGTYTRRATVVEEVVDGSMWTMDQIQGVVNVNVPVRMVVVKLSSASGGGLWIHNPLAPTPQLLSYVRDLASIHGPVRHIVLGSVALEHKATFGPFAQYFPRATVWVQRGQWSFPIQLPIEYLGVVQGNDRLRTLPSSQYLHGERSLDDELRSISVEGGGSNARYWAGKSPVPEWTADIDYETLEPIHFRSVGAYSENAFFHKATRTLIVTDAVCSVTSAPPPIVEEDPRALLYHSRDSIRDEVVDDEATRRRGWRRMVQFGLVFFPSQIDVVPLGRAVSEARRLDGENPSTKKLGEGAIPFGGSLYPWTWHDGDADIENFNAISRGGKLFCPPILTKLILDREPERALEWVDRIVGRFDFARVIPGHLNNYVKADRREFAMAFDPLRSDARQPGGRAYPQRALAEDLALLQEASDILTQFGIVDPSRVCDLEMARQVGRFRKFQLPNSRPNNLNNIDVKRTVG